MRNPVGKYIILIAIFLLTLHLNLFSQHPAWMYWDPWTAPIPSRIVNALEVDADGIKWIGTEPVCGGGICTDGGLAAFDGVNWTIYDSLNSSLNSNFIRSLGLDLEEVLWVGTGHGQVSSFDGSNWEAYPFPIPVNVPVTSISCDLYGHIWAATEGNGIFMYDGAGWDHYHSANSILSNYLSSVEAGPDNAVWTGGTGDLLFKFTGSEWEAVALPDELFFTSAIAIDHENRIWVGSDGVFCSFYAGAWTVFDESITGIPDSTIGYVFDITFDDSGNTWIGHSEGLIKYDGAEWTTFLPSNSGMLSRHVLSLAADILGNLWIGTADTGLIAYQEGGVVKISDIGYQISDIRFLLSAPYPNPSSGVVN
ncbi:MAG: hypothetical protein ABFS05_08020, partial [Bacteroidota bacterium]